MNTVWLGYNGLTIQFTEVIAVLFYQQALNDQIIRSYGAVPSGVRAVVVTVSGEYWPSRWHANQIRDRWAAWRKQQMVDG